jgi:putative hydrolase of the HAD superfamily
VVNGHTGCMVQWSSIDAVVFDIGGVFLLPHPDPIRTALQSGGLLCDAPDEQFRRAHYRAVHAVADLTIPDADPAFWREYELAYLREIGLLDGSLEQAIEAWVTVRDLDVMGLWRWVEAHNVATLRRLAAAGVPIAVVSNNDGTAAVQMERFGVCQVGPGPHTEVVAIVDSGAVGVAKPDPAIFRPALEALGTEPHRTLYVGDMVHADVRGARAAGMPVVQIDPYDFHATFDHPRAPHLDDIADRLLA